MIYFSCSYLFLGNTVLCVTLLCHVTETSLVFDQLKEAGQAEPDKSSNNQPEKDAPHVQKYEFTNRKRLFRTTSGLPQEKAELVR